MIASPSPTRPAPRTLPFAEQIKTLHWTKLDQLYTTVRREVAARRDWRFGPARVREVAREAFDATAPHGALRGGTYCDLGCGVFHPHGVATVMHLNGADATIALDLHRTDPRRAAEALGDLLLECLAQPDRWHWSDLPREEFLERARRFDLDALRAGRLADGLAGLPLRHVVTDIHHPSLEAGMIDIMSSRAVLEHFLDFERAAGRLFALLRPGGVASHVIDLVDHRAYDGPAHHHWSFLTEDEHWTDGLVNRLRSCELRACFERAGFEVLAYATRSGRLPDGFRSQVAGRFQAMSDEELAITTVHCVLRRPAS